MRLILSKYWRSRPGGKALILRPGKHTVRVAITADPPTGNGAEAVRAVSNSVEIEVPRSPLK
jgi:hypothetical protein